MGKKLSNEEFIRRVNEQNEQVRNGQIEILSEYDGIEKRIRYLCHKCHTIQEPVALSLLVGNGCAVCGKKQSGITQRKSKQQFIDELTQLGGDIIPLGEYVTINTKMDFMCAHGHVWTTTPGSVLSGTGCPYCSNRKVLDGYNDIATTSPDIFKFLANPDDGYKYTRWSNVRVNFKCPLCGWVQNRRIGTVAHRGFHCEHCSSGLSYPNKFGRAFFDQLPLKTYSAEYYPEWGKPYVYDIYFKINEKEYIVEWDGAQHFEDRDSFGITLNEHQAIDKIKDRLAQENNVCLIRVDCAKSQRDYIKNSIEKSELNSLFDLTHIDWMLCDEYAQKNLVKIACDYWMSGMQSFDDLAEKMHLGNSTVRDYIRRGAELGWCDYHTNPRGPHLAICVTDVKNSNKYFFKNMKVCSDNIIDVCGFKISKATIRKYCNNGHEYKGLRFEYVNPTTQN